MKTRLCPGRLSPSGEPEAAKAVPLFASLKDVKPAAEKSTDFRNLRRFALLTSPLKTRQRFRAFTRSWSLSIRSSSSEEIDLAAETLGLTRQKPRMFFPSLWPLIDNAAVGCRSQWDGRLSPARLSVQKDVKVRLA